MGAIIRGMIHTEAFNDKDRRPKNWRQGILYLYPNGSAPLTALMSLTKSEKTDDPQYHWWTKKLNMQTAPVTGVFTNSGLSATYNPADLAAAAKAKDTLYFQMEEADAKGIRKGHQVLLRDTAHDVAGVGLNAEVTDVAIAGSDSYIQVRMMQDDFAVTAGHIPGTFDHAYMEFLDGTVPVALVIGSISEEGDTSPDEIVTEPVKMYNYTQIFKTSLSVTRTASKTRLRTGDQVKQAKNEALEVHSIEMEKAFIFGVRSEEMGDKGKPKRTTGGIINTQDADGNFLIEKAYFTGTWEGSGDDNGFKWLMKQLKEVFKYGNNKERIGFCGADALLAISYLASSIGTIQLKEVPNQLGLEVTKFVTPFGTLYLKQHPLFDSTAGLGKSMLIVDDSNLIYRFIDDTSYQADIQDNDVDGEKSQYLTEAGLELHHPETFRFLANLG